MRGTTLESGKHRTLAVINQFALPRDQPGGTRHVDLYGALPKWRTTFIAGDINHAEGYRYRTTDRDFIHIRIPTYRGNGLSRILGWGVFFVGASFQAIRANADIYLGSSPHLLAPLAGLLAATLKRRPFILEVRDLWPESIVAAGIATDSDPRIKILRAIERRLYTSADAIIGVTPGWESYFKELHVPPGKFTVVTNGTSQSASPTELSSAERDELRQAHDIVGPAAVFAGSHGPKDGIGYIVSAAQSLPDVNFYLYGGGSDKANQMEQAKSAGLTNIFSEMGFRKKNYQGCSSSLILGFTS